MKSFMHYLTLMLLLTTTLSAQQTAVKTDNGVSRNIHQAYVGKLVFTSSDILKTAYSEKDFLQDYLFTPKSDLYFTVFLEHSLTHNLKSLHPQVPADVLVQQGSYQFSFYVDGSLIYRDHLHPGSFFPEHKNNETIISRPLVSHPFQNWWSSYLWYRFKKNGGDSVLIEGRHSLKIELRPYLSNPDLSNVNLKVGEVVAAGEVRLNIQNPHVDPSTVRLNVVTPYAGLPVSKESFDTLKIKELKAREQEDLFKDITSVVVLKNSKILLEEYFNSADRNTLHDVRSVGKTFASTMTGIAISEGFLKSENQTLDAFYNLRQFQHYSAYKDKTTIKQLLTMSSMFAGDDNSGHSPGREDNMYPTSDWVKFALDLPVDTAYAKGQWHYFTAGVVLLGDIIHKSVPGGLEAYAAQKLFKPLGITNYTWQYTPQKVANTAGGIRMNALDFAKFGQLYKNRGKWNGKQVVSKQWVQKSLSKVKSIPGRENEYYGFLFWNKTYHVNGRKYEAFYCAGNGGNHIYIFKDIPFVIVVTAMAYNRPYAHTQVHTIIEEYVLPAVVGGR